MLKRTLALLLSMVLLFSMAGCRRNQKETGNNASGKTEAPAEPPFSIYLNGEWESYYDPATHRSTRQPDAEDVYHIPLILDGDQVELTCTSKKLVNLIDQRAMMGLTLDANGRICDVTDIYDMPELFVAQLYITGVKDDIITTAWSLALSSLPPELKVTGSTKFYDISPTAEVYGFPAQPEMMDQVTVFTKEGTNEAIYIFITQRAPSWPIFWRVDAVYGKPSWDAEKKCTTRVPDENGVYTIRMAKEGQQVDVLCKDIEIVNRIDSLPAGEQYISLRINEDGYADEWAVAYKGSKSLLQCNQFDVTQLQEDGFTTTRTLPGSTQGATWEGEFADDCRIYDTTGSSGPVGIQVDSLQLGDRVIVLSNWDGDATTIFITQRTTQ